MPLVAGGTWLHWRQQEHGSGSPVVVSMGTPADAAGTVGGVGEGVASAN